jgi:hypothetical protein
VRPANPARGDAQLHAARLTPTRLRLAATPARPNHLLNMTRSNRTVTRMSRAKLPRTCRRAATCEGEASQANNKHRAAGGHMSGVTAPELFRRCACGLHGGGGGPGVAELFLSWRGREGAPAPCTAVERVRSGRHPAPHHHQKGNSFQSLPVPDSPGVSVITASLLTDPLPVTCRRIHHYLVEVGRVYRKIQERTDY